jgi:hypothetical protein
VISRDVKFLEEAVVSNGTPATKMDWVDVPDPGAGNGGDDDLSDREHNNGGDTSGRTSEDISEDTGGSGAVDGGGFEAATVGGTNREHRWRLDRSRRSPGGGRPAPSLRTQPTRPRSARP